MILLLFSRCFCCKGSLIHTIAQSHTHTLALQNTLMQTGADLPNKRNSKNKRPKGRGSQLLFSFKGI